MIQQRKLKKLKKEETTMKIKRNQKWQKKIHSSFKAECKRIGFFSAFCEKEHGRKTKTEQ